MEEGASSPSEFVIKIITLKGTSEISVRATDFITYVKEKVPNITIIYSRFVQN
jgi:hypothetical protein